MALGRLDNPRAAQPMSEINMTPLIDVMLVLLVIFILAAPALTRSLKLDLPKVAASATPDTPKLIAISIDASEKLFLDNQPINVEDLNTRFIDAGKATGPSGPPDVQIRADQNVRYKALAEIMSMAQKAGLARIALVTQQPVVENKSQSK